MTDRKLIELLRSDPEQGLAAVVKQYSCYVYKIATSRLCGVCSKEDIEEAVSDIFIKFYTVGQESGFAFESVRGSLSLIGGRHCINVFNKHCKKPKLVSLDDVIELPADETGNTDIGGSLTDAIDKLGEPYTTIFIRKYFFGQTSKDVAKDLDIKPNTVDKRISRGLVRLRQILEEEEL
ncbi:RNA polymerase sigma factor [Ruminococcus albus]|uniref:RNA polymerase sigma-70 factor, ECF subfamily n=1 Tax=Ruminococcus albus TaxID=1264 RepID=A0A1I1QA71_RUMAL|nr:sigma-70 family RNA polymerase sigma factor [Ruminococcus albus]SFD18965.1 RNA polymerase sigma-70 factor, ECF subfamily [Ruminococcus albus]